MVERSQTCFVPFPQTTGCCIRSDQHEPGYTLDTVSASPGGRGGSESHVIMFIMIR